MKAKEKARASEFLQMDQFMKANGRTTNQMEKDLSFFLAEIDTLDTSRM
jgi:hypothetical protein